jgi:HEAT repeat protein
MGVPVRRLKKFFEPNIERMERKRNVMGLIKALKNRDAIVRHQAASALRRLGSTLGDDLKYNHVSRFPS